MRFDVTNLRLFAAAAEAGSITRGAARCHLALPSASARIAGMEAAVGVPLFTRGRRGVTPTPAGLALLHHARAVLRQMDALHAELAEHAGGLRGHVRLTAHTAALTEILPDVLAGFLVANPGVDVALEERESRLVVRAVAENRADLGIVSEAAAQAGGLAALATLPFHTDRLVLVVPRDHPLAARRSVAFAEVVDAPMVGLRDGSALQDHLAGHAAALGRTLTLRVRMPGFESVCRMAGAGVGLAVVPETAARRHRRASGIAVVRLDDPWAVRRLVICLRDRDALTAPARRLLDHLAAAGAAAEEEKETAGFHAGRARRSKARPAEAGGAADRVAGGEPRPRQRNS